MREETTMRQRIHAMTIAVFLGIALISLAGCAGRSKPARFYVLSPVSDSGVIEQNSTAANKEIAIGIARVSLPKYLRKPQIVTRTGSNELDLAEYDRWAGRIEDDIRWVIAENLSLMLATDKVFLLPVMEPINSDYTLKIEISRFDGPLGGTVEFSSNWIIADGKGDRIYGVKSTHISEPTRGGGYAAMVAAQSRVLAVFSREVAEFIKGLTEG
jgi:uncharacterized lipoprotein YmbA